MVTVRVAAALLMAGCLPVLAGPASGRAGEPADLVRIVSRGGELAVGAEDCISPEERSRIEEIVEARRHAAAMTPRGVAPLYEFFPMAGVMYEDLAFANYVDLDPTSPGVLDWDCTNFSYDGHQGHDVLVRTFGEQLVGVPIFAALDGVVTYSHDGESDMNTTANNQPGNGVVIDHGFGRSALYWHLRNGSVAVTYGQRVRAGEQIGLTASSGNSTWPHLHFESWDDFIFLEPFTGACNPGPSGWRDQQPSRRDTFLVDFTVSSFADQPGSPYDTPRTGTFALGRRMVAHRILAHNLPWDSTWRTRYRRPNGSIAYDSGTIPFDGGGWHFFWWTWQRELDLDAVGTWRIVQEINGQVLIEAPFDVVAAESEVVNRPPHPIFARLEPADYTPEDVVFCRVIGDPLLDDPDYDIVRYEYTWRVNGEVFRQVTSAARSDAIPHHSFAPGDVLECTVRPTDGVAAGTAVSTLCATGSGEDADADGVASACDTCPAIANPTQLEPVACIATDSESECVQARVELVGAAVDGAVVVRGRPSPQSITLELLETCGGGDTYELLLNGVSLGVFGADFSFCVCNPTIQERVVSDAELLAGAWSFDAPNVLRIVRRGSNGLLGWARARLQAGGETVTSCLYDHGGGDCTGFDLCIGGFLFGELDHAAQLPGFELDAPFLEVPFLDSELPGAIDVAALPAGEHQLCVESGGRSDCQGFSKQAQRWLTINLSRCTNQPPSAASGGDRTAECRSPDGAPFQLDGSGSSDPDSTPRTHDDIVSFRWTADAGLPSAALLGTGETLEVWLGAGAHDVTLEVTDTFGESDTDVTTLSVLDTLAPTGSITVPADGSCFGPGALPVVVTHDFSDACAQEVAVAYDPAGASNLTEHGDHTVTVTARDDAGNSAADAVSFTIDRVPPLARILARRGRGAGTVLARSLELALTASDADGAAGGVTHERITLEDCTVYDGLVQGDRDGLLSDEKLTVDRAELCRIAGLCGRTGISHPVLRFEATDCAGNVGWDTLETDLALDPDACGIRLRADPR